MRCRNRSSLLYYSRVLTVFWVMCAALMGIYLYVGTIKIKLGFVLFAVSTVGVVFDLWNLCLYLLSES